MQTQTIKTSPELQKEGLEVGKRIQFVAWVIIGMTVTVGTFASQSLLEGDWSFWIDWKDRRYFPILGVISYMLMLVSVQAACWIKARLPVGMTLCAVGINLWQWFERYVNWWGWFSYPMNELFPETVIPCAIAADCVLLLSRKLLLTYLFGAYAFALTFYPANWVMIAPFHQPIEALGQTLSIADYIGFSYVRSAIPEYLRMIESGTLRTFEGGALGPAIFFSGVVGIFIYAIFWWIGDQCTRNRWVKKI
ncbi:particulate methane monooxygenase [Methylacidiphilum kamchatkense Kam1]|uniref:Particulate methane monooxygenase n=2 Tax=Methylacidiphilum kamchatkense TaxID=431057 RepID=A0A0C1UUH7_9BACT|nr:methane monooxygenase/ammonia monooxygenase subunit A [Methylacidiphilum kamchatkense]ACK55193.1 PmoA3 [Methylacidiphilum kamchatkense Kam1]AFC75747.1 PmoA3 [Methylacidiphilum kamchatkense Kam1]KIE59428.1 particulate methane monooxygenase [Methylacidiphilum kamchatkense Kam1]QDQ42584.1 particulate methane monooxygenase PmoA subunit [Methylacidiphilum kamchatkense Kam1]